MLGSFANATTAQPTPRQLRERQNLRGSTPCRAAVLRLIRHTVGNVMNHPPCGPTASMRSGCVAGVGLHAGVRPPGLVASQRRSHAIPPGLLCVLHSAALPYQRPSDEQTRGAEPDSALCGGGAAALAPGWPNRLERSARPEGLHRRTGRRGLRRRRSRCSWVRQQRASRYGPAARPLARSGCSPPRWCRDCAAGEYRAGCVYGQGEPVSTATASPLRSIHSSVAEPMACAPNSAMSSGSPESFRSPGGKSQSKESSSAPMNSSP